MALDGLPNCGDRLEYLSLIERLEGFWENREGDRFDPSDQSNVRKLGKFEIVRMIGSGGFGIVYQARDRVLDRLVAIKIPRVKLFDSDRLRNRFFREAKVAAKLDHPNICKILEARLDSNLPHIVSQFCAGPNLAEWIAEAEWM